MYRVILVDDEPLIRLGLRGTVEWDVLGLEICGEATNGAEALAIIQTAKPQILITDIKMPLMDGLELIRSIRSLGLSTKIIILSGYSEYNLLKEAIALNVDSYLLKPIDNDELISILNSIVDTIEHERSTEIQRKEGIMALRVNTLNRLITNNISPKEFKEKAELIHFKLESEQFLISVAYYDRHGNDNLSKNAPLKMFAILNICEEIINSGNHGLVFMDSHERIVFLMESSSSFLLDEEKAVFGQISHAVNHYLGYNLLIGIGTQVHSLELLYQSYKTALHSLDYALVTQKSLVHYEAISNAESEEYPVLFGDLATVELLFRKAKIAALHEYLEQSFQQLSSYEYISLVTLQNKVMQIVMLIFKILEEKKENLENVMETLHFSYLDVLNLKKMNEILIWLKQFCAKAIELLPVHSLKSLVVRDTLQFIDEHYKDNISLKLLADKLFVNASYLGNTFKKEMGESFTDYVNRLRVAKAKELLLSTDLKVYEISEQVGYVDPRYFTEIFRKYTGTSPTDLKKTKS